MGLNHPTTPSRPERNSMSLENPICLNPVGSIETEIIDFFVHLALTLSLPRSVGGLFGYLYCSEEPQPFDDIVDHLQISRGSASQGLRFLESANAVHRIFMPGDRRTFYRAEISLRALFSGFLENKMRTHLQTSEERLESLTSRLKELDPSLVTLAPPAVLRKRLEGLQNWHRKAQQFLPWVSRLTMRNS